MLSGEIIFSVGNYPNSEKKFLEKIDKKNKFFYFYRKIKLWVNTKV